MTPCADVARARGTVTFGTAGFPNLMDAGASLELPWASEMDDEQASAGARWAPASLLDPWRRGSHAVAAAVHAVPAPGGTLSDDYDERGWVRTGDLSRVRRDDARQIRSSAVRSERLDW
jgi:hypothetical protein